MMHMFSDHPHTCSVESNFVQQNTCTSTTTMEYSTLKVLTLCIYIHIAKDKNNFVA